MRAGPIFKFANQNEKERKEVKTNQTHSIQSITQAQNKNHARIQFNLNSNFVLYFTEIFHTCMLLLIFGGGDGDGDGCCCCNLIFSSHFTQVHLASAKSVVT